MGSKHYYIYKGYWWFSPWVDRKVFHEAPGLIIKCYTEEEFKKIHCDPNIVWEKVEVKNGNVD